MEESIKKAIERWLLGRDDKVHNPHAYSAGSHKGHCKDTKKSLTSKQNERKKQKKFRKWQLHTFSITFNELLKQERQKTGHSGNNSADGTNQDKQTRELITSPSGTPSYL
ncbi:MAG: hypothetical protein IKX22_02010 [Prevotella sp.]|nr:hypothetical protein [Prevotella sp.]